MKVQKTLSLDAHTAQIAENMSNFSQFVRVALAAYELGNDFSETERLKRVWIRVANDLKRVIVDLSDQETADEAFITAVNKARSQIELDVE